MECIFPVPRLVTYCIHSVRFVTLVSALFSFNRRLGNVEGRTFQKSGKGMATGV
jgi:hypothetical protein